MRGGGCIINDIIDQDIDPLVERTKSRPIACGRLSVKEALAILMILCLFGFFVFLRLNLWGKCIALIAFLGSLIYPYFKRFTHFAPLFLALIFNSGTLLWNFEPLHYIFGIFWTLCYDGTYAEQDIIDDQKIGVYSLANHPHYRLIKILNHLALFFIGVFLFSQNWLIWSFVMIYVFLARRFESYIWVGLMPLLA